MSWMVVDLPQPLEPTRATVCPTDADKFSPFKTCQHLENRALHLN
jgi:hypothetical protein